MAMGDLEWFGRVDLPKLSFADLYSMFQFVSVDYNKQFGANTERKKLIKERYDAILNELNMRAYGKDPYKVCVDKTIVVGENPEDINLDHYNTEE